MPYKTDEYIFKNTFTLKFPVECTTLVVIIYTRCGNRVFLLKFKSSKLIKFILSMR